MKMRAAATNSPLDHEAVAGATKFLLAVRDAYGPWTHVIDNSQLTPVATARAIHEAVIRGYGRL